MDDNPGDIRLLREALAEITGEVILHHVENAVQAFAWLAKRPPFTSVPTPDLIILDIRMPIIPGTEALQVIREDPRWRRIPVVVLTVSQLESEREACLRLGACDYLIKPAVWQDSQLLAQRLARHILRARELRSA